MLSLLTTTLSVFLWLSLLIIGALLLYPDFLLSAIRSALDKLESRTARPSPTALGKRKDENTEQSDVEVAFHELMRRLYQGRQEIVSHDGISQYSQGPGGGSGISACGPAALNCARVAFGFEEEGYKGPELLYRLLCRGGVEEIASICSFWTSNAHLEVDDLLCEPLFKSNLYVSSVTYEKAESKHFRELILNMLDVSPEEGTVAAIITRPPEIVTCLKVNTEKGNVFIVFDSHPRPMHPRGCGFILNTSVEATVLYLSEILAVDHELQADESLQWQAQLLSQFSAHILLPKKNADIEEGTSDLQLNATLEFMKSQIRILETGSRKLEAKVERLEIEVVQLTSNMASRREHEFAIASSSNREIESEAKIMAPLAETSTGDSNSATFKDEINDDTFSIKTPTPAQHRDLDLEHEQRRSSELAAQLQAQYEEENMRWGAETRKLAETEQTRSTLPAGRRAINAERVVKRFLRPFSARKGAPVPPDKPGSSRLVHTAPSQEVVGDDSRRSDQVTATQRQRKLEAERDESAELAALLERQYQEEDRRLAAERKALLEAVVVVDNDSHPSDQAAATEQQRKWEAERDESAELAALLERQYQEEDMRLAAEIKALAEAVPASFDCVICSETLEVDYIATIGECGHSFCRSCLREHTVSRLRERRVPITCPLCTTENGKQKQGVVSQSLIEQLGIPESDYRIFEELQLAAISIPVHCRKCKNTMYIDRTEYEQSTIMTCPLQTCRHTWCTTCQQMIDPKGPEHSCDGSSELKDLIEKNGWKYCPGCKIPVQKSSGCNHMTCMAPGCNTHFCYVCGGLITRSSKKSEVDTAISSHYSRCKLFEGY